jgi:DNA helicase-2/ATP-dependent DNA helicase PcrA
MVWSRYQEDIFRFGEKERGHLVVIARAGCGKTTTIKELCRRLSRSRILVCAFNNKIRDELSQKLQNLRHVQVKGLNQIGFGAMIRFRGQKLKVDRYRIRDFVRRLIPDEYKEARSDVIKLVTMCMANLAVDAESIMQTMYYYDLRPVDPKQEDLYRKWTEATLAFSERPSLTISFDEQVYLPARFNLTTGSYDIVIVDEAQDLNACQYRIVMNAVKPATGRIFAVGDDRQAIYAFRGADANALAKFQADLNATVLPLSVTYRCPRAVVNLARRIVNDFEAAPNAIEGTVACVSEKEFLTKVTEGDAVISRTNAALSKYCMLLLGKGRRARIIGRDLNSKLDALLARTRTNNVRVALEELSEYVAEESDRLIAAGKDDKAEELKDNLEALRAISEDTNSVETLRRKVAELFDDDESVADKGIIPFMTVHKAKGLEFERVWMFESTFRVDSTEGENLYYVAVTRAQRELYLVQIPRSDGVVPKSIALEQLKAFEKDAVIK